MSPMARKHRKPRHHPKPRHRRKKPAPAPAPTPTPTGTLPVTGSLATLPVAATSDTLPDEGDGTTGTGTDGGYGDPSQTGDLTGTAALIGSVFGTGAGFTPQLHYDAYATGQETSAQAQIPDQQGDTAASGQAASGSVT